MTTYQAARKIQKWLVAQYGDGSVVWDTAHARERSPADAPCVAWEGGPFDWPILVSEAIRAGKIKMPSTILAEPVNGWLLAFYRNG